MGFILLLYLVKDKCIHVDLLLVFVKNFRGLLLLLLLSLFVQIVELLLLGLGSLEPTFLGLSRALGDFFTSLRLLDLGLSLFNDGVHLLVVNLHQCGANHHSDDTQHEHSADNSTELGHVGSVGLFVALLLEAPLHVGNSVILAPLAHHVVTLQDVGVSLAILLKGSKRIGRLITIIGRVVSFFGNCGLCFILRLFLNGATSRLLLFWFRCE